MAQTEVTPTLRRHFEDFYNPQECMVRVPFKNPGYHSHTPTGKLVHETRTSFNYACELLLERSGPATERAHEILDKVIALQDQDPVSETYGIWSWHLEEPLDQMDKPDWNWADFCGFALARILHGSTDSLSPELHDRTRQALFHAAGSIYRRNMGPHYTNISIMGGIVTTLAGELLPEPRLLAYGVRRLQRAIDHYREQGGFNEYNSPTYTRVVLLDCEKALGLVENGDARTALEFLFEECWRIVAESFHPATGQWAGPHSRDYHAFMRRDMSDYLAEKTGVPIKTHPLAEAKEFDSPIHDSSIPCPAHLIPRFQELPEPELQTRSVFSAAQNGYEEVSGTTWMNEEACLGSVNGDFCFSQRRLVLGYWNGAAGSAVALRLRFLHDGEEFCSAFIRNVQKRNRVLSAVELLLDRGDTHPVWDKAPEDVFAAEDFRIRYELRGEQVFAEALASDQFRLWSGDWEAVISPAAGRFGPSPVSWAVTQGDSWVAIDGVCHEGERRAFPFREIRPVVVGAGLHLRTVAGDTGPIEQTYVAHDPAAGRAGFTFDQLSLGIPDHAAKKKFK